MFISHESDRHKRLLLLGTSFPRSSQHSADATDPGFFVLTSAGFRALYFLAINPNRHTLLNTGRLEACRPGRAQTSALPSTSKVSPR